MGRERADAQAAASSAIPCSSARPWMATRASGSAALPWRSPTTRSVPPATGREPAPSGGERLGQRRGGGVGRAHRCIASQTRCGVIGRLSHGGPPPWRSRFRPRRAWARTAARRPPWSRSARRREPARDPVDLDRGHVGRRLQLVVEQVGVQLTAVGGELRALGEGHADAHRHAALDLPVRAYPVEHGAGVVGGGHLEHPHDAGRAVDLAPHGVSDERRGEQRLHARAGRCSRMRRSRAAAAASPTRARAGACRRRPCRPAR